MSDKELSPEERAQRGKRLLMYGMVSLVIVTIVAVFVTLWLIMAPLGLVGVAVQTTLIIGVITIIACAIVWFLYTRAILKE